MRGDEEGLLIFIGRYPVVLSEWAKYFGAMRYDEINWEKCKIRLML